MSTNTKDILRSFDLLPDTEKREVATEIIRRTFRPNYKPAIDETRLAELYAEFAADDSALAEQGIEEYGRSLNIEDAQ